jgi:hypothetical protein
MAMASNENEPRSRQSSAAPSAEDIIRAVHDDLAAIDDRVFGGRGAPSLDEHLNEIRYAAQALFRPAHG